jgi:hypothetical protein
MRTIVVGKAQIDTVNPGVYTLGNGERIAMRGLVDIAAVEKYT